VIRPYSHSLSDDEKLYKTKAERAEEATRDPVVKFAAFLRAEGLATDDDLAEIAVDVDREINQAADAAVSAPRPTKDTAGLWVYSPDVDPTSPAFETPPRPEGKPDTMVATINRPLKDEMARDPRIVVFDEDVADATHAENLKEVQGKGGVFKVTHGLQKVFGSDRVFNSALAEASIVGRAVGLAIRGLKPVVEIQFFDYIWPAMMQLRNEVSMLRYRSSNNWSCPMVIRVAIGGIFEAERRTTASRARASSRIVRACALPIPPMLRMPPGCCGRRFARTIRCSSWSTSTSTGRPTTRPSTPDRTT